MDDRRGVQATYERIADHFAKTREYPWPEVESFCEDRSVETALDVGCGNGRHAELLLECADRVIGLDVSPRLLDIASERVPEANLLQGDASALPISSGRVALAVYVATLHHLPTRELRQRSLDELSRVLEEDGTALVSAWSTAHDAFDASADDSLGFDTHVEWTLPSGETVPRFYHIYAPAEFDTDLEASQLAVTDSWLSSGNCYAVVTAG
jgi:ubiquinone/menaquinone biosynthesis C-methylase UbiE